MQTPGAVLDHQCHRRRQHPLGPYVPCSIRSSEWGGDEVEWRDERGGGARGLGHPPRRGGLRLKRTGYSLCFSSNDTNLWLEGATASSIDCSAGADTIVYDRGLLLLAGLVWEKNTVLARNLRSFTTKRTGSCKINTSFLDYRSLKVLTDGNSSWKV